MELQKQAIANFRRLKELLPSQGVANFIQFLIFASITLTLWVQVGAIDTARQALQQNSLATIYSLSLTTFSFLEENPELLPHFDKHFRGCSTDEDLRNAYNDADIVTKGRIQSGCEKIADFMQIAFTQRELFPDGDWNTWWSYFCDAYDESPKLRDYLENRMTWYEVTPILRDPKRRQLYFR